MSVAPTYLIDTNILVRFFRNDDPEQSAAAAELFKKAAKGKVRLQIPFVVVFEVFHVLRANYRVEKAEAVRAMQQVVNAEGIAISGPRWIEEAIEEYSQKSASFADACIATEARHSSLLVASFDRDFAKFEGVERYEPSR